MENDEKNEEEGKPAPASEENQDEKKEEDVDPDLDSQEDTDFEKELEALEDEEGADEPQDEPEKPKRSELDRAKFSARQTLKRIKELGGDPSELFDEEPRPAQKSQYVTKTDLMQLEAEKLARSPAELKLIMFYIKNRSLSVSDAHLLANKGRIKKTLSEIQRSRDAVPANPGGGPGGDRPIDKDVPALPEADRQRLLQSGMVYDPKKKAYVGSKVQHRFDEKLKGWVTEKL